MPASVARRRSSRLKARETALNVDKDEEKRVDGDDSADLEALVTKSCEFIMSKVRSKTTSTTRSDDFIPMNNEEESEGEKVPSAYNTQPSLQLASELLPGQPTPELYFNTNVFQTEGTKRLTSRSQDLDKLMERSVITPDFEKRHTAPPLYVTASMKMKQRQAATQQSAGPKWFNLPATEITPELEQDLKLLKLRNVLDRKRHYKRNDTKGFPKYFQMGTIVEGAADFYSSRLPKRDRKNTLVNELMADKEFRRYNKKKFLEIHAAKQSGKKGFYRKKLNKRKPNWARR